MKPESIAFGISGVIFGLIAGWVIGSQQATVSRTSAPSAQASTAAPASGAAPAPAVLDESKAQALKAIADKDAANANARTELGNLYFDAERYDDAIKWYSEAVKLAPADANLSTDLGVSYYYTNQPDKALAQFETSLKVNPKHTKTLLNVGIVKAFGKQDLEGATQAWQQVLQLAPDSPEGQAAKRALDSMKAAHPGLDTKGQSAGQKPGA